MKIIEMHPSQEGEREKDQTYHVTCLNKRQLLRFVYLGSAAALSPAAAVLAAPAGGVAAVRGGATLGRSPGLGALHFLPVK